MLIKYADYQAFYEEFLTTFLDREKNKLTGLTGKRPDSPMLWDNNAAIALEIFGGGRIQSARYFYRLHDAFKPERIGIGEINDFAYRKALEYIGVELSGEDKFKSKVNPSVKTELLHKEFIKKFSFKYSSLGENQVEKFASSSSNTLNNISPSNSNISEEVKVLLNSFEVGEILCKTINKYQASQGVSYIFKNDLNIKSPEFEEIQNLISICTADYSFELLNKVVQTENPYILYQMRIAVELGVPFLILEVELKKLLNYLGDSTISYRKFKPQFITKRLRDFEDTRWLVYYPVNTKNSRLQPLLGQAIMEFCPFGRVKYKSKNRSFVGHYNVYGDNENYLLIELCLAEVYKRNLRFLVYCGADKPEVMPGQYSYLDAFTSANTILESTQLKYSDFQGKHLTLNDKEYFDVHPDIQKYFSDHNLGRLTSPTTTRYSYL